VEQRRGRGEGREMKRCGKEKENKERKMGEEESEGEEEML